MRQAHSTDAISGSGCSRKQQVSVPILGGVIRPRSSVLRKARPCPAPPVAGSASHTPIAARGADEDDNSTEIDTPTLGESPCREELVGAKIAVPASAPSLEASHWPCSSAHVLGERTGPGFSRRSSSFSRPRTPTDLNARSSPRSSTSKKANGTPDFPELDVSSSAAPSSASRAGPLLPPFGLDNASTHEVVKPESDCATHSDDVVAPFGQRPTSQDNTNLERPAALLKKLNDDSLHGLQHAIRRLHNCVDQLRRANAKEHTSGEQVDDPGRVPEGVPSSSPPVRSRIPVNHAQVSPQATPRRSRFGRVIDSNPSTPASPSDSPTGSARHRRTFSDRWQSAISSILSPSPRLPRSRSVSETSIGPVAADVARWRARTAELDVRQAQVGVLASVQTLQADLAATTKESQQELPETALFLAQAIAMGLQLPALQAVAETTADLFRSAAGLTAHFRCLLGLPPLQVERAARERGALQPTQVLVETLSGPADRSVEDDVFGTSKSGSENMKDCDGSGRRLKEACAAFCASWQDFSDTLMRHHSVARQERRRQRLQRRQARLAKAKTLYNLHAISDGQTSMQSSVALMSTEELLLHSLDNSIARNLFSADDANAYEPRVLLALPRLALLFGVSESIFPLLEQEDPRSVLAMPRDVFLPRICRSLSLDCIRSIRTLSPRQHDDLCRRLALCHSVHDDDGAKGSSHADLDSVFRSICTEADTNIASGAQTRQTKLMKQVLQLYQLREGGNPSAGTETLGTVSKAYLSTAGLPQQAAR